MAVLRNHAHGGSFTAYPPGYTPYGRVPLVDLGLDGSEVEVEPESDPFDWTFLAATEDAARGEQWARAESPAPPDAVRSTQRRRLLGVAALLGLIAGSERILELVAEVAQVPAAQLVASAALVGRRGLAARGEAVRQALQRLLAGRRARLAERVAVLGYLAGRWGRPYRCHCQRLTALGRPFWSAAWANASGGRPRDGP